MADSTTNASATHRLATAPSTSSAAAPADSPPRTRCGPRGIRAVVLEKSDQVGASWRRHYDRLHLHTTRRLSGLPGLPMPRRFGRWVSRDNVVRYLEKYAEHHELEIVTGVEVSRVERTADGTGWLLHATGGRELTGARGRRRHRLQPHARTCPTGPAATPSPANCCTPASTATPEPYAGRDVLVVGVGNTGAEIAVDLVEGGAARVRLAVRTAPHIVRRSTAGWAAQYTRHPRTAAAGRPRRPARRADGQAERAGPVGARAAPPRHRALHPRQRGRDPGAGRRPDRRRAQGARSRSWPPSTASRTARSSSPTAPASSPTP